MLASIKNPLYRDICILWGLHFTTFPRPATKADDQIIAGLLATYAIFARRLLTTKDEELKRNTFPILRFLRSEIERRVMPERLKKLLADDMPAEQETERSQTARDESDVDEVVITKEIPPPKKEETPP
jgi:hypothetical protein